MARVRPFAVSVRMLIVPAALCLLATGCSGPENSSSTEGGADQTPAVREARSISLGWLADPDHRGSHTGPVRNLRLLRLGLKDKRTRAAFRDSFLGMWAKEPSRADFLELFFLDQKKIEQPELCEALLARATGGDTTSAVAHFIAGRRNWKDNPDVARARLVRALNRIERDVAGDPLLEYLARRRLARISERVGAGVVAIEETLELLPLAWVTGGAELAGQCWYDIYNWSVSERRHGDALAAATLAYRFAELCADPVLMSRALLGQGRVHQERNEFALADSIYELGYVEAVKEGYPESIRRAMARRTVLSAFQGDLSAEFQGYQALLAHDTSFRDTARMILDTAALGDVLRRQGALDESEGWFARGYELAEAFSGPDQHYLVDRFRALLLSQLGRYAEAETLLVRFARSPMARNRSLSRFGVQLAILDQGLESDRPDLAYRALARAEELLDSTSPDRSFDPVLQLRMMSAKLHAKQGEYHLADADLEIVAARGHQVPPETRWYVDEAMALVAGMAGDRETEALHWGRCLALADTLGAPDLMARSRVRLAANLMASGHPAEAARLVAGNLDAPEYWTRLNATIITGLSQARRARHAEALETFARAESMLGADPPADLAARLALEKGKALAATGRYQPAHQALLTAREILDRGCQSIYTDLGRSFNDHIVLETAEALLELLHKRSSLASGDVAAVSRDVAGWGRQLPRADWQGPTLEFFVGNEAAFAWIGDGKGHWSWRALPSTGELGRYVADVVLDTGFPGRAVDEKALRALGSILLKDLPGDWDEKQTLGLLPHGMLHRLPWAALPEPHTGRCLLARGPLAIMMGGADMQAGRIVPGTGNAAQPGKAPEKLEVGRSGRLLVLASDESEDPTAPVLRQAEAEARSVARIWSLDRTTLRLNDLGDFRRQLEEGIVGYQAIHIASHARVYEGADGRSSIHLAGSDGPLTLPELAEGRVETELVFLSCCEGARRHHAAGQGVTSFAQAFSQAGARSVIATRVLVDEEVARKVAERFYQHWGRGTERAAALRSALLELAGESSPGKASNWSHPFHWGYYQLYARAD